MDSHSISLIISLALLLICSAFFSASETAFSSLNRVKLKNLGSQGNKRAMQTLRLAENYDQLLSTVLIGNNIVNIAASALATVLFVGYFGNAGVTIATAVTTVLVLIFGEISPKTMAKEAPESFAMFAAPALRALVIIFTPVNRFFVWWKRFIVKLFKVNSDRSVTEEEFLTLVGEVRQEGGINAQEEDMIRQAIEFDDLSAGDIFTPRVDVEAVSEDDDLSSIEQKFFDTGYSRLPIYRESIDNIIGLILQKDFNYRVIKQGQALKTIIKPVVFITKSMKISRLLKTLQEKKCHLAVIVDEFGGTVGIVTIEDIIEELVGEIWDEHDEVVEDITKMPDGSYRILGNADLEDMFTLCSIPSDDERPAASTVGSWVMERLGRIPKEGDTFTYKNISITVSKTLRHRVMEIIAVLQA